MSDKGKVIGLVRWPVALRIWWLLGVGFEVSSSSESRHGGLRLAAREFMGSLNYNVELFLGPPSSSARVALEVRKVDLLEYCSRPFRLSVVAELGAHHERLDVPTLLNQEATLEVTLAGRVVRYVQGIVVRAKELLMVAESAAQRITFEVAPPVTLLKHTKDSRIFLKQTTADIVKTIFESCGLSTTQLDFQQAGKHTRDVCTQYEETSFDFISRLLEEEGICYFFKHDDSG